MFNEIYQRFKASFNESILRFLFQRTALGMLLSQDNIPSPWEFFNTYFSSWWLNRLFFFDLALPPKFDDIVRPLTYLQQQGLFNEDNTLIVVNHANPSDLAFMLSSLQHARILNQENFNLVANPLKSRDLFFALPYLQRARILNPENFNLVANHANPFSFAYALYDLQESGMLNTDNLDFLIKHANPLELASALVSLKGARLLTLENQNVVVKHPNPRDLASALTRLDSLAGILNQDSFTIVANQDHPINIAGVLIYLHRAGILNQENQDALIHPNHVQLLGNEALQRVWGQIPSHLLTQANFQQLLVASRAENPLQELERVTTQIIGVVDVEARPAQVFNDGQSTHRESVHRSVSTSARKLMDNYGRGTNLEAKIKEIKAFVQGLDGSPKHQAAKRCITRITARDYFFTDTSGVSTRQLLALAFRAIHDETKRNGSLEDAKALFIQALYEIQRGYNINEQGFDDGQPDRSICLHGTFNKIMEKLNGIHTDVEIYYITPQGANFKFPKLAEVHALQYLRSIAFPNTPKDFQQSKAIIYPCSFKMLDFLI